MQRKTIHIHWVPTKEMLADNLTKALLSTQKHYFFVKMTGIEDQKDFLVSIERKKDNRQQPQTDTEYSGVYEYGADAT